MEWLSSNLFAISLGILVLLLVLLIGYTGKRSTRISGFGKHIVKTTEAREYENGVQVRCIETKETQTPKTIWDWMVVLTISAVIGGAALWYSSSQDYQQRQIQTQQADDDALLTYLDTMSVLIFDRPLLDSIDDPIDDPKFSKEEREQAEREREQAEREREQARDVARASTLVALGKVGPDHKRSIVKFLYESDLITTQSQIVDLTDANLLDVKLKNGEFPDIDLSDAYLGDGDDEELEGANLIEANLEHASLQEANLRNANLQDANLQGAVFGDGEDGNSQGANLKEADLQGAVLKGAVLKGADLQGANLRNAKLEADATGNTNNRLLDQQGVSLKGATMPNGQKYEAWLQGVEEAGDEETTDPS